MSQIKIKDFKMNIDDRVGIPATLPCSLSMALAASEEIAPWQVSAEPKTVEFTGVVEIEPHLLSMKHICLRLAGVSEPAEVILNGRVVSTPESRERIYVYNVKDRLFPGYNTIVIRFDKDKRAQDTQGIRLRHGEPYDPSVESVSLLAFNSAAINSVNVTQTHSEEGVALNVHMGTIGDKTGLRAVATLVSPSGKIYYGSIVDGKGTITVSDPLLWWPLGLGVQNLYDLSVNLYHGDVPEDVFELRVGLRELSVANDGRSISLKVGSQSLFLRGMSIEPERYSATFISEKRAKMLVGAAVDAGVNAFYISARGRMPDDAFLDLCDKNGILVILGIGDRITSDSPLDDAIKREIVDGPRRISYHASFAAFYVDKTATRRAQALAEMLSAYCFSAPVTLADGEPTTSLLVSAPDVRTRFEITGGESENVLSYSAERRIDPAGGFSYMLISMTSDYLFPTGARELTYLSELSALDKLEAAYSDARLSGKTSFFADRLCDPEPQISSSTVDYFGRRTAAHYRLSRLYSPVTVLHHISGYEVAFTIFNDRAKEYSGTITYRVLDRDNRELHRGTIECNMLAPMSSVSHPSIDLTEYLQGRERERYLVYSYSDGAVSREATVLFTKPRCFNYRNSGLRASVSGSGRRFDLTLYPEGYVGRLVFGFSTMDAVFSENCIDLCDNAPRRVSLETADVVSAERLESELTLMHLGALGSEK